MAIVAVHNHNPTQIETLVKKLGFKFEMWDLVKNRKKGDKDVIYGFTSITSFLEANIVTTPIIFDTPTTMNHVNLNTKVIYVDCDPKIDGLIYFTEIKIKKLKKALTAKFKNEYKDIIVFRKNNLLQYGINSELTKLVNQLLVTIPAFSHEAVMVALTNTFKNNKWAKFEIFLKENRLITNQNKKILLKLGERINILYPVIKCIVKEDKSKFSSELNKLCKINENYKMCIKRIRFYLRYWGSKNLKNYLDDEGNINFII